MLPSQHDVIACLCAKKAHFLMDILCETFSFQHARCIFKNMFTADIKQKKKLKQNKKNVCIKCDIEAHVVDCMKQTLEAV